MKENKKVLYHQNIKPEDFDLQLFGTDSPETKAKIEETDKIDDTKKADEEETEAKEDKEKAAANSEEAKEEKKDEAKSDDTNSKEEAYKAAITELKSIVASQSKRLDLLEDRLVELSASSSKDDDDNSSSDSGFIAM